MMLVNKARVISCLFLYQVVLSRLLLSLCFQTCEAMPKLLLVVTTIMSVSSMLSVALLGFILLSANLMCFMSLCNFKHMLNDCLSTKLSMFSQTGGVSIVTLTPSFRSLASHTMCLVLIHISRMVQLNVSIVILLTPA